jgi:peptide/nickel transport system ATP-binding protein
VGESGCGKTTLGKCVLKAIEPTEGSILFALDDKTVDLAELGKKELRAIRPHAQMIFQDPYSSLNPRMTVLDIVAEPLIANTMARGRALEQRVAELVRTVGLDVRHIKRYPHAFSGGQRQRIGIARALATNPKFIVADEPVSALDVSVQAEMLNLMQDLQEKFHLTYLFISHDLSVIEHIADRVAVMYVGKLMEMAETEELFLQPRNPYTEALLSALPKADPDKKMKRIILSGEAPNPAHPPKGCYFHPRCTYAKDVCRNLEPAWEEISPGHFSRCHFSRKLKLAGVE